jgi:hypothetical protein
VRDVRAVADGKNRRDIENDEDARARTARNTRDERRRACAQPRAERGRFRCVPREHPESRDRGEEIVERIVAHQFDAHADAAQVADERELRRNTDYETGMQARDTLRIDRGKRCDRR